MYGKPIDTENCYWDGAFNHDDIVALVDGWILTGRIAFFLVIWLNINLYCTVLRRDLKYRNLAAFTTVLALRRGYHYIFYVLRYMDYDWVEDIHNCSTYGFIDTFLGVYEVESLTHICIERYVVAKYIANGWPIRRWHYFLYQCLCLFFSLLYSLAPLFGVGNYVKDFSCLTCTYNMVLPDTWERYAVLGIFLLRSAKPVLFMFIMRYWTQQMEAKYDDKNVPWVEVRFAHIVDSITTTVLGCWLPITTIRAIVIVAINFLNMEVDMKEYVWAIQWAVWVEWFTPAVVTVSLMSVDHLLRSKMFGGDKTEEDIIKVFEKED